MRSRRQEETAETTMTNVKRSPTKVTHERNSEQRLTTDQVTTRSGRVVKKPKRFGDYEL